MSDEEKPEVVERHGYGNFGCGGLILMSFMIPVMIVGGIWNWFKRLFKGK